MRSVTNRIPYFTETELACKSSGIVCMDPRFAAELPRLREAWGRPLTLNSVCRTPAHNAAAGGHPSSLHLTANPRWPTLGAMAADVRWRDWHVADMLAFARLAWRLGWAIGLHNGFCHVDRRGDLVLSELPRQVFVYGSWDGRFGPDAVRKLAEAKQ